jgi:hypothetical protein
VTASAASPSLVVHAPALQREAPTPATAGPAPVVTPPPDTVTPGPSPLKVAGLAVGSAAWSGWRSASDSESPPSTAPATSSARARTPNTVPGGAGAARRPRDQRRHLHRGIRGRRCLARRRRDAAVDRALFPSRRAHGARSAPPSGCAASLSTRRS